MAKPITPAELKRRLDAGEELVLLDVREPEELAICKLEGALHVPMGDVPSQANTALDPDGPPIVCICHHGIRSANVAAFLEGRDYERVYNLTGGVDRWAAEVDPEMARY